MSGGVGAASLALDHVVLLCDADAPGPTAVLRSHGLVESFRRSHPAHGTANVCFAFDNAYVELLWVTDMGALEAPAVAPTGLAVRCAGALPFATWPYRAPFLPPGAAIDVAADSRDPAQPLVFHSPDARAPVDWPGGIQRQREAGYARLAGVTIVGPRPMRAGAALGALVAANVVTTETWDRAGWGLALELERADGTRRSVRLEAP